MRRFALFLALLACALLARGGAAFSSAVDVAGDVRLTDIAAFAPPAPEKLERVARTAGVHVSVAPAPETDRLPAVPPPLLGGALNGLAHARFEREKLAGSSDAYAQIRVRRHVPRMDSGDPPRVRT